MVFRTKKGNLVFLILSFVTICFFFFRFYNLINRMNFDWDQASLSFFASKVLKDGDLTLIGHQATDVMGFYFAPYFEYLSIPFYFFSSLDPIAQLPFIVVINLMLLPLMFYVMKKLCNVYLALAFVFLWGLNPLLISYDTTVWTPMLVPPGIFLTFLCMWRLYRSPSRLNFLFLGLVLGFFSQSHSLFFFLDFFVFFFFIFFLLERRMKMREFAGNLVILLFGFAVFLIPLVIFDLRHNFLNSRLFVNYLAGRSKGAADITQTVEVFSNFVEPLIFSKSAVIAVLFYIAIGGLLLWLGRNSKAFSRLFYFASLAVWILGAVVFLRYKERPSEYYFLSFYPFIFLALLDFLQRKHKYAVFVYCSLFLLFNLNRANSTLASQKLGMVGKKQVISELKKRVDGKKYSLTYDMPLGFNTGYDYLLKYYKIPPSSDPKDPLVRLRLPAKKNDIVINSVGIVLPKELK